MQVVPDAAARGSNAELHPCKTKPPKTKPAPTSDKLKHGDNLPSPCGSRQARVIEKL
jgi:hypothetical protein